MKYLKLFESTSIDITYENVKDDIYHFLHDFEKYWIVQADHYTTSNLRKLLYIVINHENFFNDKHKFPWEGFVLYNKLIDLYKVVIIDLIVEESDNDPDGYRFFLNRIPKWIKDDSRLNHFNRGNSANLWNMKTESVDGGKETGLWDMKTESVQEDTADEIDIDKYIDELYLNLKFLLKNSKCHNISSTNELINKYHRIEEEIVKMTLEKYKKYIFNRIDDNLRRDIEENPDLYLKNKMFFEEYRMLNAVPNFLLRSENAGLMDMKRVNEDNNLTCEM